jgi:predicted site-specific integrase-resolvase
MSNPTNAEAEKPLAYRVKPFCQRVGISPATFYKYVGLRKIRVVKIGGRTLVPASEAERLLSGEAK